MTLTTDEIVGMRATLTDSLPETVQVSRATRVADGAGGQTETYAVIATVPGRLSPELNPPAEPSYGDRPSSVVRWQIVMPQGTDCTNDDRLLIGTRTFEVRGVDEHGEWAIDLRAHCTEIL